MMLFNTIGSTGEALIRYDQYNPGTRYIKRLPLQMLPNQRVTPIGGKVGNFVLIGGYAYDVNNNYDTDTIDVYDSDLVYQHVRLSFANFHLAAIQNSAYMLFGGGNSKLNSFGLYTYSDQVDSFDRFLTRTQAPALPNQRCQMQGVELHEYAIFAGGRGLGDNGFRRVDAYDTTLTRTSLENLSVQRDYDDYTWCRCLARAGNFALISGGDSGTSTMNVGIDVYDSDLTRRNTIEMPEVRVRYSATEVGSNAFFAGGIGNGTYKSNIIAFDDDLTRIDTAPLKEAKASMAASSIGLGGLFAGGEKNGIGKPSGVINDIDIYNQDLTREAGPELTYRKYESAAIELGDSVIIAGGWCDTGFSEWEVITRKSVDVIQRTSDVTVDIGANARYSFDGIERKTFENIELTLPSPVNGYIKYKSNIIH